MLQALAGRSTERKKATDETTNDLAADVLHYYQQLAKDMPPEIAGALTRDFQQARLAVLLPPPAGIDDSIARALHQAGITLIRTASLGVTYQQGGFPRQSP